MWINREGQKEAEKDSIQKLRVGLELLMMQVTGGADPWALEPLTSFNRAELGQSQTLYYSVCVYHVF